MSLNCNEIDLILSELDLEGSFIQQIVQPSFDSLALYTYKNGNAKTVYISLAAGACRIHETRKKIPKNEKPLRFMEYLKKHIKGARIQSCKQIDSERIIKMEITHPDETYLMFIRLWSGAPNIIVTNSNLQIQEVFFRRPKKNEVTGGIFVLPEAREKTGDKVWEIRTFEELQKDDLSFNEKVDLWYSEHAQTLSREALLEQAEKYYLTKKSRMEAALKRLTDKKEQFQHCEQWKHQGDLILSFGHCIDGESNFLECIDYETDNKVRIQIDPKKSVQNNANEYYKKYKKAMSGLDELEYDIQKAKKELLDLDAEYELVKKEPNPIRIEQILRKQNKPKQQIQKKHPGLSYILDDWYIIAGRDASENDELLRHHVKGQDMWMHTRDWPGGYIFIKYRPQKTIPLDVLLAAGNLAIYFSKARKAVTADLYYTQVKYLRRAKNAPKGTVLPTHEKNITITLNSDILKKMEEAQLE